MGRKAGRQSDIPKVQVMKTLAAVHAQAITYLAAPGALFPKAPKGWLTFVLSCCLMRDGERMHCNQYGQMRLSGTWRGAAHLRVVDPVPALRQHRLGRASVSCSR